jgi:hypothetical protein
MPTTFLKDICYQTSDRYCGCLEFHFDEHHRRAFSTSQLIGYALDPNPEAENNKNAPPQKLALIFSTADVVILGWRLGFLADKLCENTLTAVGIFPKRYAELDRSVVFVSAITITPVRKE